MTKPSPHLHFRNGELRRTPFHYHSTKGELTRPPYHLHSINGDLNKPPSHLHSPIEDMTSSVLEGKRPSPPFSYHSELFLKEYHSELFLKEYATMIPPYQSSFLAGILPIFPQSFTEISAFWAYRKLKLQDDNTYQVSLLQQHVFYTYVSLLF